MNLKKSLIFLATTSFLNGEDAFAGGRQALDLSVFSRNTATKQRRKKPVSTSREVSLRNFSNISILWAQRKSRKSSASVRAASPKPLERGLSRRLNRGSLKKLTPSSKQVAAASQTSARRATGLRSKRILTITRPETRPSKPIVAASQTSARHTTVLKSKRILTLTRPEIPPSKPITVASQVPVAVVTPVVIKEPSTVSRPIASLPKPVAVTSQTPKVVRLSIRSNSRRTFETEFLSKKSVTTQISLGAIGRVGTIGRGNLGLRFKDNAKQRLNRVPHVHPKSLEGEPVSIDSLMSLHMKSLMQKKKGLKTGEFNTPDLAQALLAHAGIPLTNVTVTPMKGGFVSGEVCMIEGYSEKEKKRERFFLKYLRQGLLVDKARCENEVRNLQKIRKLLREKKLKEAGFSLILPLFSGQYSFKKEKKLFTILPAAKGRSLTHIVRSDVKKNPGSVFQASFNVGFALGTFQSKNILFPATFESITQRYLKANIPAHCDFHPDNIFLDEGEGVSLIDLETLANSFDENDNPTTPLAYDIFYFIQQAHRRFEKSELEVMKKLKWKMYTNFIDGYIAAFPADQQKGLGAYLESCFRHADEVRFVDIFPKVMGHTITWGKAPDDKYSKEIIAALRNHLRKTQPGKSQ